MERAAGDSFVDRLAPVEFLNGRRWLIGYVLCLAACGLASTRGIFYGAVLAVFVAAFPGTGDRPAAKQKRRLMAWSLLPSVVLTGATLLVKHAAGPNSLSAPFFSALSFAAHELFLNPLYTLISYPGRHVGILALALFGAAKMAIFIWAIMGAKQTHARALLLTLLAFDVVNALALGYGRIYTGDFSTVNSRYQDISLLCFRTSVRMGAREAQKRSSVTVLLVLWLGVVGYPWKTHIGVWTLRRGSDVRTALKTGAPEAIFDPSFVDGGRGSGVDSATDW